MKINSKEYWDERFASGSWDEDRGAEQSYFFAEVAYELLPDLVKRELATQPWTLMDIGCAEGKGTALLTEKCPSCHVTGLDISEEAIKLAKERHPQCEFVQGDVYQQIPHADVIFSSNMLEHLENPQRVMERMCEAADKYVILLLPLEDRLGIREHINIFSLTAFPIEIGDFFLEYTDVADCSIKGDSCWPGFQIILVYTNRNHRAAEMTLGDVHDNYGITAMRRRLESQLQSIQARVTQVEQERDGSNAEKGRIQEALDRETAEKERVQKELSHEMAEKARIQETLGREMAERGRVQKALDRERSESARVQEELGRERSKRERVQEALDRETAEKQKHLEELNAAKDERQKLTEQLETARGKAADIQKELDQRCYVYDDLYAYSAKRDIELEAIKNSRSYKFYLKVLKKPLHILYRLLCKLHRMCKDLVTFNFRELAREFYLPVARLVMPIRRKAEQKKKIRALQSAIEGKTIIVMPPTLDWHMRLFQRPQQLATAYAKKPGITVIYLTANLQHDHVAIAEQVTDSLWLVYSGCTDQLCELLHKAKQVIMSMSWTINKPYVGQVKPDKLIYEYIDELEIFDKFDKQMITDHKQLMSMADVTVCTASKLFDKALKKAKNPILSPNAGDYEFFSKTAEYEVNPLIRDKIEGYKCILGYYGALASWFDYGLVKEVAERHPDWLFILVGMNYDGTLDKSGIQEYENILWIPPQPYQELPSFLTAFDVATIPFVINEITLSTSPVKLFEYMAGGKPILTSKMPECLKYQSVRTYAGADEFCRIVGEYMAMKPNDEYWNVLEREARENTWDARTDQILKALDDGKRSKR